MIEVVLICLAFVWIIFASIEDIKKREVEDWLSYSLIIFALGFRFFYSLFYNDYSVFYLGLIGLCIFFILGNVLYYCRTFAGADAKLMIALGTILPISASFIINLKFFVLFLFLFFFVGGVYGIIWSFVLSIKNSKSFKKDFSKRFSKNKKIILLLLCSGLILMSFGFSYTPLFLFGALVFIIPYLFIYAKSVDSCCMQKNILPSQLTVGDWLVNDVKIGKKTIKANWDGLLLSDIKLLIRNKKKVLVRYGIPFIPVFLISLILFLLTKNYFLNFFNLFI